MDEPKQEEGMLHISYLHLPLQFMCLTSPFSAPPSKKRKLEETPAASTKKTKTTEEAADEEEEEEDEDDAAEAPEDEDDEQEQEDDEPAVKTKVIKGSEPKTSAAEAEDEAYEGEE